MSRPGRLATHYRNVPQFGPDGVNGGLARVPRPIPIARPLPNISVLRAVRARWRNQRAGLRIPTCDRRTSNRHGTVYGPALASNASFDLVDAPWFGLRPS
jgi:hypothetical protein